jgi:hypothetical protein
MHPPKELSALNTPPREHRRTIGGKAHWSFYRFVLFHFASSERDEPRRMPVHRAPARAPKPPFRAVNAPTPATPGTADDDLPPVVESHGETTFISI